MVLFDIAVAEMFGVKGLSILKYGITERRRTRHGQYICYTPVELLDIERTTEANEPGENWSVLLVVTGS